jgi:ferredoxin
MIFYFSATGNSKYVAERIAAELNTGSPKSREAFWGDSDQVISITQCIDDNTYEFSVKDGEHVGIVSPTYFLGLPAIVKEFLERVSLKNAHYVYFIATYGTTTGQTGAFTKRYINRKGLKLDACFNVKMPDVWTPIFNLTNQEKIKSINNKAEFQIDEIISLLKEKATGDFMRNKVPMLAAKTYYRIYDFRRKTSHFKAFSSCTGCGLCAKKCPAHAIDISGKRPMWVKERCIMCLGCLHRCPTFSIQYGRNTKKHGQYLNPNTTV